MNALYTAAVFTSAALLFLVQPIMGKRLLPLLGGTPNVWNTCMVFFQAALLLGYGYAHISSRMRPRAQGLLHLTLLLSALAFLPIGLPASAAASVPKQGSPVPFLLFVLTLSVGFPLVVLSASGPMLQRWFSVTPSPDAGDPYFLYAASNAGSMIGLLSYPLLVEPLLDARAQGWLWSTVYIVLCGLAAACVYTLRGAVLRPPAASALAASAPPSAQQRTRWLLLAFAPSSLLLGTTTHISTDLAPVPLLWVIPLAIYLLTFTLVFARKPPVPHPLMLRLMPSVVVIWATVIFFQATQPIALLIALHLLTLFIIAMCCHGELARLRPDASRLTEFYFWLSLGGVLGGAFNAFVAPVVFTRNVEYPAAVVLAALLMPRRFPRTPRRLIADLLVPLGVAAIAITIVLALRALGVTGTPLALGATVAPAAVIALLSANHPVRFALSVAALLLAGSVSARSDGYVLHRERNFFGTLRVLRDSSGTYHELMHGNTVHGAESFTPGRRNVPLTYYTRTGPAARPFEVLRARARSAHVGIVGLGAGSLASYGSAGDTFDFYEINPAVERIARDTRYFTFLADSRAATRVIIGDARLRLREARDRTYDMLVLDAFSSDAIPVHLLTREAMRLYERKVKTDGLIALHVSNRYLELHPLIAGLALDAQLVAYARDDLDVPQAELDAGKEKSRWIVLAHAESDLGGIPSLAHWYALRPAPSVLWTDDFSNVLTLFKPL